MQGWDDDENRQKVVAEGKLQKAASADQHDMGKLQQGQQQQQHHMVAVWVLTTAASQNFQKLCRCSENSALAAAGSTNMMAEIA